MPAPLSSWMSECECEGFYISAVLFFLLFLLFFDTVTWAEQTNWSQVFVQRHLRHRLSSIVFSKMAQIQCGCFKSGSIPWIKMTKHISRYKRYAKKPNSPMRFARLVYMPVLQVPGYFLIVGSRLSSGIISGIIKLLSSSCTHINQTHIYYTLDCNILLRDNKLKEVYVLWFCTTTNRLPAGNQQPPVLVSAERPLSKQG